jgi:exopolysaccharide production protein ExoZ
MSGCGCELARLTLAQHQIKFIALLRGVAALLVVWAHLVGTWCDRHGQTWLPLTLVRQTVNIPLGIIQDFGYFAVVTFFLISGFIITHIAQREGRWVFAIKRLFRIYPPLIASMLLIFALFALQPWLGVRHFELPNLSLKHVLQCFALVNYFKPAQSPINGVAWTLVVEMLFYGLCWLGLPWLKTRPVGFSLFASGVCAAALAIGPHLGYSVHSLVAFLSHIPVLLLGQLLYFRAYRRISTAQWTGLSLVVYAVWVAGLHSIHSAFYPPENSFGISLVLAYGLFTAALLLEEHLQVPRGLQFYANISYSLYLNHGLLGGVLLELMVPKLGYSWALLLTLAGVSAVCYGGWKYIELPSQRLGRRILHHWSLP